MVFNLSRRFRHLIEPLQHWIKIVWKWVNKVTHNYVFYLAQAIKNFSTKGSSEAVIFGFWALFSLFPLVMLVIVVTTFILGEDAARQRVYEIVNQNFPGGGATLIQENINQAIKQRDAFGFVGMIGLLYGAVGLFTNLQRGLNRTFRGTNPRPLLVQLFIGALMLITMVVLITISLLTSTLFTIVGINLVGSKSFVLDFAGVFFPVFTNAIMFGLLYRFVPRRKITWQSVIPAALLAAIIWELGKKLFGWYVANLANFGLMYGSIGTVIGLLTWLYLTGGINFPLC